MIQIKITLIVCNNTRLCGITMEWINNKCLILNGYMPYDVGYDDGNSLLEYINVMHEVKLLIDTHNPTHIIYMVVILTLIHEGIHHKHGNSNSCV